MNKEKKNNTKKDSKKILGDTDIRELFNKNDILKNSVIIA